MLDLDSYDDEDIVTEENLKTLVMSHKPTEPLCVGFESLEDAHKFVSSMKFKKQPKIINRFETCEDVPYFLIFQIRKNFFIGVFADKVN